VRGATNVAVVNVAELPLVLRESSSAKDVALWMS